MAQRKKSKPAPPAPKPRLRDTLWRWSLTGLATVLLLYGTGYGFARTEGFRSILAGRLEKSLGIPITIGGSSSSWRGDITLTGIYATPRKSDDEPAVQIGTLRLATSPLAFLSGDLYGGIRRADLDHWRINMVLDEHGRWQPDWLTGVTDWMGRWGSLAVPVGTVEPTAGLEPVAGPAVESPPLHFETWSNTVVSLTDGAMEWRDTKGTMVAFVTDVGFVRTPLHLPTREAGHYHLTVGSAKAGATRMRDLDVELLRTGDSYLVLNLEAVRHQVAPAADPEPAPPVRAAPAPPPLEHLPLDPAPPVTNAAPVDPIPPLQRFVEQELKNALRE